MTRSPTATDYQVGPDRWRDAWANLGMVALAAAGILLIQIYFPEKRPLMVHGITDEIGHLLTAFIFAVAMRSVRVPSPVWAVLFGGVILDLGHISDHLDITQPVIGSSRNGSHSLLAVALIAAIALADRRRGLVWLGVALGALSHLWRDMGTGTVPLGWPFVGTVQGVTYATSIVLLVAIAAAFIGTGTIINTVERGVRRRTKHSPGS